MGVWESPWCYKESPNLETETVLEPAGLTSTAEDEVLCANADRHPKP